MAIPDCLNIPGDGHAFTTGAGFTANIMDGYGYLAVNGDRDGWHGDGVMTFAAGLRCIRE